MHGDAHEWVRKWATHEQVTVVDFCGRDLNGSTRDLFPGAEYVVVDRVDAPDVDIVADATRWVPDREYDFALCTGSLEHIARWPAVVRTMRSALKPGGRIIVTCAGPGFVPHSGIEVADPFPGEHYENVSADELGVVLENLGFDGIVVKQHHSDTFGTAIKRRV